MSISNAAAIAGIGATEFSKKSGRSELRLAIEAVQSALSDAGIEPTELQGLVSYTMDNNEFSAVSRNLGMQSVTFFAQTPMGGGGACGTVALAAMAVATGAADVVVCYRAMNERSQLRLGQPQRPDLSQGLGSAGGLATGTQLDRSWGATYGMVTAATCMAQSARRYMHQYGATSEDFGRISVASRRYASTNPAAWFYERPITIEEHQTSRLVADPLRLLDCCQESDGAVALVVTSAERARSLRQPPVLITAAAQGIAADQVHMATVYREDMGSAKETEIVGRQLWAQSGLKPTDMDVAIIYDHFSCAVLMQLEALGFCAPGEAPDFIRDGAIDIRGRLPVNTHGGQLGEAYIHGFNGMTEAVRQLRGTAANQVPDVHSVVVTAGSHVPTSGMILTRS